MTSNKVRDGLLQSHTIALRLASYTPLAGSGAVDTGAARYKTRGTCYTPIRWARNEQSAIIPPTKTQLERQVEDGFSAHG